MLTLGEARRHIGAPVVYRCPHGPCEEGVITSVGDTWVYVRYAGNGHSKATSCRDLELTTTGEEESP